MGNTEVNNMDSESEITLADIVEFFQDGWKQLLAAGIIGAAIGFGGWSFFGTYKAELILKNNINAYGLDIVSWRILQKSLPSLAHQMYQVKSSTDANAIYRLMSDANWWSKNVVPTYAISKADAKDLAGISKDLEGASTTILNLTVISAGSSKIESIEAVRHATRFIKSGSAYLQIKSILNGYEGEVIGDVADIQNKITTVEIDQAYLKERVKSLDELHKRFPSNAAANQQVVDPKDSGAKYLPLTTQIIAINNDINQNKESLARLNDRLNQIALMKQFLVEALPLVDIELDGILLTKSLLSIEEKLRKGLPTIELKDRQALDQLRSQLLTIETRFTKGLEATTAPVSKKSGMIKAISGGVVGIGFLMLVVLLGRKVLSKPKRDK
jgi:hypothetical protein